MLSFEIGHWFGIERASFPPPASWTYAHAPAKSRYDPLRIGRRRIRGACASISESNEYLRARFHTGPANLRSLSFRTGGDCRDFHSRLQFARLRSGEVPEENCDSRARASASLRKFSTGT